MIYYYDPELNVQSVHSKMGVMPSLWLVKPITNTELCPL